jgi:RimJ/RimL family protein N-acetyltransferase
VAFSIFRTERLLLREWRDSDREPMARINRDPRVTEFLNQRADGRSLRAFDAWLASHWERFGFGVWAVEAQTKPMRGVLLGFTGIAYPEFLPAVAARAELGWRLASGAWGQGFATEAATAARDDAFLRLALPEVISLIDPRNVRSQRVAQKVGLTNTGESVFNAAQGNTVDIWQRPA